jgi:hypothetical protein
MPPEAYLICPACGAKLRVGRSSKPRVRCPRCTYVFDASATQAEETVGEENLDPFAESARSDDSTREIVDPFAENDASENMSDHEGDVADVAAVRKPAKMTRPAPSTSGSWPPGVRTLVPRVMPPAEVGSRKKSGKKRTKQGLAAFQPRYVAGTGFLLVLVLVCLGFVVFRHRLTMDEIAGTYLCDKDPETKVTLYADGTCAVQTSTEDADLNVADIEYTFDGRKITLKSSEEMKPIRLTPVQAMLMLARGGSSQIDEAVREFNDLSYEKGTLYSRSKGRFTREDLRDESDDPKPKAKAVKPAAARGPKREDPVAPPPRNARRHKIKLAPDVGKPTEE